MTLGTIGGRKVRLKISKISCTIFSLNLEINIVTNMEHDQKMKRWTDAEWPKQWYLNRGGALDMNVEAAWDKGFGLVNIILTNFDF